MRAVIKVQPFMINQQVLVYKDQELIDTVDTTLEQLPNTLFKLYTENNVNEVMLGGNHQFTKKISQDLTDKQLTAYGYTKINVVLL